MLKHFPNSQYLSTRHAMGQNNNDNNLFCQILASFKICVLPLQRRIVPNTRLTLNVKQGDAGDTQNDP